MPASDIDAAWVARQQQLAPLDHWDIQGRIAIYVNDSVQTAGLRWNRADDILKIVIEAPFGQGSLLIESKTRSDSSLYYQLSLPDGKTVTANTPESLFQKVFRLEIPITGLNHWVKGIPLDKEPFEVQFSDYGYPDSITQRGWKINYLDFPSDLQPSSELPEKIYLKHERLAIKLSIEQWQPIKVETNESDIVFPSFN